MRVEGHCALSVKVECKGFSFCLYKKGKKMEVEERCRGVSSKVRLSLGSVAWVRDCTRAIADCLELALFFRTRRCLEAFIWVQLVENQRGRRR